MRSTFLALLSVVVSCAAFAQSSSSDSQTLKLLLAEVQGLRHDLKVNAAMAERAQTALYRLQRQDEAVARATLQLADARARVANFVSDKGQKVEQIQSAKVASSHSDAPDGQRHFEEVVLPELKAQLELIERDEQQARAEESEAEQRLRDEQTKLDALNDTLDRLNAALEDASRR
jgi:hypothetical protein